MNVVMWYGGVVTVGREDGRVRLSLTVLHPIGDLGDYD